MHFYWIDIIIVLVIFYHLYDGWVRGSFSLIANLFSFLGSLWLAVRFHQVVGEFLGEKFGLAPAWTSVVGYAGIAIISQLILEEILLIGIRQLPDRLHQSKINQGLGAILSGINGSIIVAFFLLLIMALPLRGSIKNDIAASPLASAMIRISERYGGSVASSVARVAEKAVEFLTVEPGSKQQIPLDIPIRGVTYVTDAMAESQMLELLNSERTNRGLAPLVLDSAIRDVAREKSRDMFVRRYFSHYDPEGKNASDRMDNANVPYTVVGENLAYAPDLASAHNGLMNSEGHRANILEERFRRIGIGVIDGGSYGKMFTQIFAD
jgi:uncharacterized protein YkwD/uncharacterized membrane protein required for colicin V production